MNVNGDNFLTGVFKASLQAHPERVALNSSEHSSLSYRELAQRSDAVALEILNVSETRGGVLGMYGNRSADSYCLMLGILKAGGIYMPLDPGNPGARLRSMIEEAGCEHVFRGGGIDDAPDLGVPVRQCAHGKTAHTSIEPSEEESATLFFTSGSTGKPKAVLNTHRGLANMARGCAMAWELLPEDRVLQFVSIGFDVSLEEIWAAWSVGAAVVVAPEEARTSFAALVRTLAEERITVAHLPTAFWHALTAELDAGRLRLPDCLRLVIVGGEQPCPSIYARWREATGGSIRLANEYGLTEAAVTSTIYRDWQDGPPSGERFPIGRPIEGVSVRIGREGEIVIGGEGVSEGYLNDVPENAKRFSGSNGDRVFRTGDTGYVDGRGLFYFAGRNDRQVKVNGHRIELGEIEAILREQSGVGEATTRVETRNGHGPRIHAYVAGAGIEQDRVMEAARSSLPRAMWPASLTVMEALPKNGSDKIDVSMLPIPGGASDFAGGPASAFSPAEEFVLKSAASVLDCPQPDLGTRFHDLGGDSLLAVRMVSELAAYGFRADAHDILMASDLRALAAKVEATTFGHESVIVPLSNAAEGEPVILFHATPGDLLGYRHLAAALGTSHPCYGVISPGLRNTRKRHETLEQMAAFYVGQLLASGFEEPYHLVGWCFGGLLAFEAAVQLEAMGKKVGYVGLIETPSPGIVGSRFYRALLKIRRKLRRGPRAVLRTVLRRRRNNREPRGAEDAGVTNEVGEALYRANLDAVSRYRRKTYPGRVMLFFAEEEDETAEGDLFGWVDVPCADYDHAVIPGDHLGVLSPPGVKMLAERIGRGVTTGS